MTLALLLAGCTCRSRQPWSTLSSAALSARFEPGEARDLGDGAVLTDLEYEVTINEMVLALGALYLQVLEGGDAVSFDPADPPEGYSLCHGGHCHAEDGSLVDYADIEAELAGDSASFVAVTSLAAEADADLLAGGALDLLADDPDLDRVDISRAELGLGALYIDATVTGGPLAQQVLPLTVDLDAEGAVTAGFDLTVDRDQAAALDLTAELVVGGTLFDGVDFLSLLDDDRAWLVDVEQEEALLILEALWSSELSLAAEGRK